MSNSSEVWASPGGSCLVTLRFFLFALLSIPTTAIADGPVIDNGSVPAAGRATRHVNIDAFGRYAITVQSRQGVSVQLVDRVSGPGAVAGRAGHEDGRIDTFLDRGRYRLITEGAAGAEGNARLTVQPYREANAPAPPKLVELKPVDATLEDVAQRSYWVEVLERRTVIFEAAGRNLADLRIWRDGTWLVDRSPSRDTTEPKVGRPLTVMRLSADLEPGLYLLSAYGGPPNAWAEDDGSHPFHLRFGIPTLPSASRKRFVVGPFGYDRFLVPSANYYRIELEEARALALDVRLYDSTRPFNSPSVARVEITKKTVPPTADAHTNDLHRPHLVTVSGPAGRAYVLQHFEKRRSARIDSGPHYFATVHAGHAEDDLDATGIVINGEAPYRAARWQTLKLSGSDGWSRRFNLLDTATAFVEVTEAGTYRIIAGGDATARFRVEPFLLSRPKGYVTPAFKASGDGWSLDKGLYVVTIDPTKKGIVEVTMSRTGALHNTIRALTGQTVTRGVPRPAIRFENFTPPSNTYWLHLNTQPGVETGVIIRPLPLDLSDPLAIAQAPGEIVTLDADIKEEGLLLAEAEDGMRLELSVDGGAWSQSHHPAVGRHQVRVRHKSEHIVMHSVMLRPKRLEPDTPLPPLPDGRLAQRPKLPVLSDRAPTFLDLDRVSRSSYLVNATSPGLYRLESTGLLATQGNLRTRVVPSVVQLAENGTGRNFLIQQHLDVGDYQVTVETRGKTKGHLGLRLRRTPKRDGGRLLDRVPARATLNAGDTIVYTFDVATAGRYRVRAIGRDRTLKARLEDKDGWPIERPNVPADFDRYFDVGQYRLIVLPEAVDVRVVTVLEAHRSSLARTGHGPHELDVDESVEHIWVGGDDKDTVRDVWRFTLPADVDVKVVLGGKMHGDLYRIDGTTRTKVVYVPPLRGHQGPLAKGRYALEVHNLHRTSGVPYSVAIKSVQLVVGRTWHVRAPNVVPLAIGASELVEISSFGSSDVAAKLVDQEGNVVARSDDRPDDWNFMIARRLSPGRYLLHVDPVSSRRANTDVTVRTRVEDAGPSLGPNSKKTVTIGAKRRVFPLEVGDGRFLVVWARSVETTGLALEHFDGTWKPVATNVGRPARLELPIRGDKNAKYRLKLWSMDERGSTITVDAHVVVPQPVDEAALAKGVRIKPAADLPVGIVEVSLERPGTFRLDDEDAVLWGSAEGQAVHAPRRGLAHPTTKTLWLTRTFRANQSGRLRGTRVRMSAGSLPMSIGSVPVSVDLASTGYLVTTVSAAKARAGVAVLEPVVVLRPAFFDVTETSQAVSVHLEGSAPRAHLWAASPSTTDFDATLSVREFEKPTAIEFGSGSRHGDVPPGRAVEFTLPDARYRFRIATDEGGVAAVARDRITRTLVCSGDVERFEAQARRVVVFNPTRAPLAYLVEALPIGAATTMATLPYESVEVGRGRLELPIAAASSSRVLRTRGARSVVFIGADGEVRSGETIEVGPRGGVVRVRHDAGPLMAWLDDPAVPYGGLFAKTTNPSQSVAVPGAVLSGGSNTSFQFEASSPTLFDVRVGGPVVARWSTKGGVDNVVVAPAGADIPLFIMGGIGRLQLRAIGGGPLPPTFEVTKTEVQKIGEGVGPSVLVGPGQARAFLFVVPSEMPIGIGVRGDSASVEAVLRRSDGEVVGRGVAQMPTLAAGTYVLTVSTPPNGAVARARVAIVGLDPPTTGPPADVLRTYLMSAGYQEER